MKQLIEFYKVLWNCDNPHDANRNGISTSVWIIGVVAACLGFLASIIAAGALFFLLLTLSFKVFWPWGIVGIIAILAVVCATVFYQGYRNWSKNQ